MDKQDYLIDEDKVVNKVTTDQLQHFANGQSGVHGIELPKGVMLRYNLASALYFFLETGVNDGDIRTCVFASDSPYDKVNRVLVSEVRTPMFQDNANETHSTKVEDAVHDWVRFVSEDIEVDEAQPFTSFQMDHDRR